MPYYGHCHCGGLIIKDWGGVDAEYHCDRCGIVSNHAGVWKHVETPDIVEAMNCVWCVVGREEGVYVEPFMRTVSYVLGCIPIISMECLNKGGFIIDKDIIRKVEKHGIQD
jgi:hypothetical protein